LFVRAGFPPVPTIYAFAIYHIFVVMAPLNKIKLRTPESVEIEFVLAGIGSRALALLIDTLSWYLLLIAVGVLWGWLRTLFSVLSTGILQEWAKAIALMLFFFVYVGYFVYFEAFWQGQTPGKKFAKIRVIRDDGRRVELFQSLLRALLRPIDDLFYIGVFFIFFSAREKRLGDMVAGTLVIQDRDDELERKIDLHDGSQALADFLLSASQIERLLPDDFSVVRSFLQRRHRLENKARKDKGYHLATGIRETIALAEIPEGTTPEIFLEAVYLAYQQQSKDVGEMTARNHNSPGNSPLNLEDLR
jgi:uncharacterized RDD family membrane protein YckC